MAQTLEEKVEAFRKHLDNNMVYLDKNTASIYDGGDRRFAESLCDFYTNKGYLTDKQCIHAQRFFEEVGGNVDGSSDEQHPPKEYRSYTTSAVSPPRVIVNGAPIVKLFTTAAKFIQKPKIVYKLAPAIHDCTNLVFYRTGAHSHSPGSVGVVNGALAPENAMLATIYKDRPAVFYKAAFGKPELQQVIKLLAEHPMENLQVNGRSHGICCYCARTLTDPRSIAAGYGPVCASNWGLPWGEEIPQLALGLGVRG